MACLVDYFEAAPVALPRRCGFLLMKTGKGTGGE